MGRRNQRVARAAGRSCTKSCHGGEQAARRRHARAGARSSQRKNEDWKDLDVYVRDDRPSGDTAAPAVWFAYSPDRKGENPRQHLKFYKGALQADAYAGFQQLYESGIIVEVACWAHTRRKFHEIHIAHASPITAEAIERIAALYAIEAEIRGSTPAIRKTIRQARSEPLLDSMKTWLEATLAKLSAKSDTAAAIRYALSRWNALTRFVEVDIWRSTTTPPNERCASSH